ncbi:MAG: SpaH/EbpB family LPXTG-anchored major pilin [Leucobacter sp.]
MNLEIPLRSAQPHRAGVVAGVCLAIIAAILFAVLPAAPAAAANPADIDPQTATELVITKLEQPVQYGEPATGLPLGPDIIGNLTPVSNVTFTATRVPGVDLTTWAGQRQAAEMTVAQARSLTSDQPIAATGTTTVDGVVTLQGSVGLYLVEETDAPAGVVASAPFLVALPLANPAGDDWLTTVYVYPKNAVVDVGISVNDEAAISCGHSVYWTTHNVIPQQRTIAKYVTRNLLSPGVSLDRLSDVGVTLSGEGAPALELGRDYTVTAVTVDGRHGFDVEFTEAGRAKLVEARTANPAAEVVVTYPTRVLEPGVHVNDVELTVDDAKPVLDQTVTKFGPLKILVHERGNPENVIEGAEFQLYLSAEDARDGRNPITVGSTDRWVTDADGYLTIDCLRFSDFVNGLDRDPTDPLYRPYFAQPISYPPGWIGEWEPLPGIVNEVLVADAQTLVFRVWKSVIPVDPQRPIPGLPVTGGQLAGIGLLGGILVAAGLTVVARRRRHTPADAHENTDANAGEGS